MTLGGVQGGNLKSWKMLRLEGSGLNLVGKISRGIRYVIDIIETDPLYWGGGFNSEKLEKMIYF